MRTLKNGCLLLVLLVAFVLVAVVFGCGWLSSGLADLLMVLPALL